MAKPLLSHAKSDTVSFGVLLICFGIMSYFHAWWPWIILAIGASTITRQYLTGRTYDIFVSFLVFGGLFIYFSVSINLELILPIILVVGGIYLIFREFFVYEERDGDEKLEEEKKELDDDRNLP